MKDWIAGFAWALTLCVFAQAVFWSSLIGGRAKVEPPPPQIIEYREIVYPGDDIGLKWLTIKDVEELL